MAESQSCSKCGARAPDAGARFCAYCGVELPHEASPAPSPATPFGDLAARFHAMREHADFELAQSHVPSVARRQTAAASGIVIAAIFLCISVMSLFVVVFFPPALVMTLLMMGAGVYLLAMSVKRTAELGRGELKRVASLIVDERTEISAGGRNSRVHTRYYTALQSETGRREEYEVDGDFSGKVAPGDVGVAYFKGNHLIDFERIPV